jgi:perosamine synthetase
MIRLAAPTFDADDRARIDDVLRTGMLVQGRYVAEFEALVTRYLDAEVVACSSGTAALHLALLALDLSGADEVIVPAFTWPSTAHVILQAGARPVFVDIDPETLNLDVAHVARRLTPRTRAVMPVHLFGVPAPMSALRDVVAPHGAVIVEDAACALGTTVDGALAGTIGSIGCFSLHPRKVITTGEGGLLCTRDPEIAARLRRLRNHGMETGPDGLRFVDPGLNYRLTELGGALGIGQMAQLPGILAARARLGARYLAALDAISSIRIPAGLRAPGNSFQTLVVDVGSRARRAAIMARLSERGIPTTIGTHCVTDQPVYRDLLGVRGDDFPHAQHAAAALLALPMHHALETADVDRIVDELSAALSAIPEDA